MNKTIKSALCALAVVGLTIATRAQTLLYQWDFDNDPTSTSSTPDVSAGGGNLNVQINSGTGSNLQFVNSGSPDGIGGILTVTGGGYSSGNTSVALGTGLTGLGTLSQFSVGLYFNLGSGVAGQFPRFIEIGSNTNYDVGGHTSDAQNGTGLSINGWSTGPAFPATALQNGVENATGTSGADDPQFGPTSISANTWYYELVVYDGTSAVNNYSTYLGSSPNNLSLIQTVSLNEGSISFTTNAMVALGNIAGVGDERALSSGSIADVEIWNGIVPVPEPTSVALIGLGSLVGIMAIRRRRN